MEMYMDMQGKGILTDFISGVREYVYLCLV